MRNMTPHEQRWWKLFKDVLKNMPATLEINVHQNTVDVSPAGARERAFKDAGHADNTESFEFYRAKRVYPNSESI